MQKPSDDTAFIRLDDLKVEQLALLAPAVFLAPEISPGNFPVWVALAGLKTGILLTSFAGARVLMRQQAVPLASAAVSISKTNTCRTFHASACTERIPDTARPGRGLTLPTCSRPGPGLRKWPSCERYLERAPPSQGSSVEN